jgi:hypothetical protein
LYFWQPPTPSHMPFEPHEAAPLSEHAPRGSAAPAGTGEHRPIAEGNAHVVQEPPQAPSQQTPSTQKPLAHSLASAHVWPTFFNPQLPATQVWPGWQSSSVLQEVAHAPLPHRYGQQFWIPGARQVPLPSHVPAVLRRAPAHEGGAQIVSALYSEQPPKPSQAPVWPHAAAPLSLQIWRGSLAPLSIGQQVPERPTRLHATHAPVHATLQHTPSVQKPDAQSWFFAQTAPFRFGPQLPATHFVPAQSESDAHIATQAFLLPSHP